MKRQDVISSNIESVGYDKDKQLLEVSFINGSVYQYEGVEEIVYDDFINSDSLGSYLYYQIRDFYETNKII